MWVKDKQTMMAIHKMTFTHDRRVTISHRDDKEWELHIADVQEEDRGWYMCEVNTDPLIRRRIYLEVTASRTTTTTTKPSTMKTAAPAYTNKGYQVQGECRFPKGGLDGPMTDAYK